MKSFTVEKNDSGQRLDKFLTKFCPKLPKALMYKYIRIKRIKINGKRAEISTKLCVGDVVDMYINDEFFEKNPNVEFYLFTKKASHRHTDVKYGENPFFFFGRESCGLPEDLLEKHTDKCVRIPMKEGLRSLNQSNSAAIAAYEYLRQKDFVGLSDVGGKF